MRRTPELGLVVCGVLLLTACGPAPAPVTPDGAAPSPSASAAPRADATGSVPAAPGTPAGYARALDWCADPAVDLRVDEALASGTEGLHNGMMVSPAEMAQLGSTAAEVAAQTAWWQELSDADLAFQQCLRARQGHQLVDVAPGRG